MSSFFKSDIILWDIQYRLKLIAHNINILNNKANIHSGNLEIHNLKIHNLDTGNRNIHTRDVHNGSDDDDDDGDDVWVPVLARKLEHFHYYALKFPP